MDTTSLMLSGLVRRARHGLSHVRQKKAGRLLPIVAGLALMVIPYFIANTIILLVVCAGPERDAIFIARRLITHRPRNNCPWRRRRAGVETGRG